MSHEGFELPQFLQLTEAQSDRLANEDGCWYESPTDVAREVALAARKRMLLGWVRREMGRRLSPRERMCVELYFFQALTLREIGDRTGVNATSAMRALRRAIRKLRRAAREANLRTYPSRRGRKKGSKKPAGTEPSRAETSEA